MNGHMGRGFGGRGVPAEKANVGDTTKKLLNHSGKTMIPAIVALVLAALSAIFTIISPNRISEIVSVITAGIMTEIDMAEVGRIGVRLIAIFAASAVCGFLQHFIMCSVTLRVAKDLRSDMSRKINNVPLKAYDGKSSGDILSRMTNDVQTLSQALSNSLPTIISAVAQFVGCIIMMFATEWRMSVVAILSTLVGFALMAVIMGRSQRYFTAQQSTLGTLNGYIEEMYTGHAVVRISRAERGMKENFSRMNEDVYRANKRAQFLSGIMQPLMTFVGNLGYVAVCVYGSSLAISGKIEFSVIVAFIMYVRLFTSPLTQIAQGMTNVQMAAASGKRIFDFLSEDELDSGGECAIPLSDVHGAVKFDHVSFGYSDDPDKIIIKDFSADIKPGGKVAIVGPTGAGKTTIVNLLMRFYELNGGKITIDGVPTDELSRENLHDMFAMVLQDTWLFGGTVRENLVYNKESVTDEELLRACRACGIEDFVLSLPHGLDTVLDENTSISAGQKQLFTIARAMIKNSPMLILDEATSSVDTRTELTAQRAMDSLTSDRTSFVIAHRLSTIKNADLILVLKDGNVIEQGDHEELLARGGFYAELYNSQFEKAS